MLALLTQKTRGAPERVLRVAVHQDEYPDDELLGHYKSVPEANPLAVRLDEPISRVEEQLQEMAASHRKIILRAGEQPVNPKAREGHSPGLVNFLMRSFPADLAPVPEEDDETTNLREGAVIRVTVNAYERNLEARRACIEVHGVRCIVCNFSFEEYYGRIGVGYIHVHHLIPLGVRRGEFSVDPRNDLIPVCANCHAMLHRRALVPLTPEELREMIERAQTRRSE